MADDYLQFAKLSVIIRMRLEIKVKSLGALRYLLQYVAERVDVT